MVRSAAPSHQKRRMKMPAEMLLVPGMRLGDGMVVLMHQAGDNGLDNVHWWSGRERLVNSWS